ncbi:MAG: DUF2169 domain-containing protein [Minicystis sp.]
MKTKNLTPFLHGVVSTSRRPRRPEMAVIVRATYLLAPGKDLALPEGVSPLLSQGSMRADTYRDDDEERAGECLYPGDFAAWKPRAEVMLRGTCHAPSGKAVPECPVRFEVGRWSKILRVVGRRFWSDDLEGAVMSEPAPFTKMPIGYTNAFGGAGYLRNPVGKGAAARELPNVEHAGHVIRARRDDPGPAGFGPLNPAWPERAEKLGKEYGPRYRKERWPYFAEDFDWSFFNAAPKDQQIDGYLRGDEALLFQNLHPAAPVLEARLPGLRIRAFVNDVKRRFREVPMSLDTLFADLDEGKLYLTWRGLDAVESDDLLDVTTLLIGSERLGGETLPEKHYRDTLEAFEKNPVDLKDHLPAELLDKAEEAKRKFEAVKAYKPPGPSDAPAPDPLTALVRKQRDQFPLPPAPEAANIDKEIAEQIAELVAKTSPDIDMKAELGKMVAGVADAPPPQMGIAAVPLRVGGPPPAWASSLANDAMGRMEQARALIAEGKLPPELAKEVPANAMEIMGGAKQHIPDDMSAGLAKDLKGALALIDERMEKMKRSPFFQALVDRPGAVEPGPYKDLHAQDYQQRDLAGADLRGADLRDANLAGANLAGANLAGADLTGAVLAQAELGGADLSGANLTLANVSSARAKGANLRGAKLDRALFQKVDLSGAVLAEAKGENTILTDANLGGVDAKGLSLDKALLAKSSLVGADLSGATLTSCNLLQVDARKATFTRATVTRSGFIQTDLRGTTLVEARGEQSSWLEAKLDDADFTRASLPKAEFLMVNAPRACFKRAILKEANYYRASLEQADLSESNLFGANFSKCAVGGARFTRSNLYGANFLQAAGNNCDFTGANLKKATVIETEEA